MSTTIHDLLRDCVPFGVGLAIAGDRLRVRWTGGTVEDLRRRLRAAKSEVLAAMREPAAGPDDPRWVVTLLADIDEWRAWMIRCEELFGRDGPPSNAAGYAVYLEIRRAV